MVNNPIALSISPCLVLTVVVSKLPLPPFHSLCRRTPVILELCLRTLACLLMLPAACRAERTQPSRRLDLVSTLVGHRDGNSKRSRGERRDRHVLHQLLELEWRRSQHAWQDAIESGYLSIQFTGACRSVCFPPLLIR